MKYSVLFLLTLILLFSCSKVEDGEISVVQFDSSEIYQNGIYVGIEGDCADYRLVDEIKLNVSDGLLDI